VGTKTFGVNCPRMPPCGYGPRP